ASSYSRYSRPSQFGQPSNRLLNGRQASVRRITERAELPAKLTAHAARSRDPTSVSRRIRRASGLLPRLASSAVPEAEARLPPDPRAGLSVEHMCHPEIRVRHDAPAARPCYLPKDRRPEVYCFALAAKEAKRGTFHLLGKSKLCSRKNAHRHCGILRCGKSSCTGPKVDCRKVVTGLSRPGFDVVQTIVAHGSGTPLMLPSPRSLELSKERANFVITQGVEQTS